MHFLLFYDVVEGYDERRIPFRQAHLAHAGEAAENGELLMGGAFANPIDGAVLLFKVKSVEIVKKFVQNDPYFMNGLIKKWSVRQWTPVVGSLLYS